MFLGETNSDDNEKCSITTLNDETQHYYRSFGCPPEDKSDESLNTSQGTSDASSGNGDSSTSTVSSPDASLGTSDASRGSGDSTTLTLSSPDTSLGASDPPRGNGDSSTSTMNSPDTSLGASDASRENGDSSTSSVSSPDTSLGRGRSTSRGRGRGASWGRGCGTSRGRGRGTSRGRGYITSRGKDCGTSRGRGHGTSRGRGRGTSQQDDNSDTESEDEEWIWKETKSPEHVPKFFPFSGNLPGSSSESMNATDVMDYLYLFLPAEFYDELLLQTNRYADQIRATHNITYPWCPITKEELMAFIGIVISMGLIGLPSYRDYWSCDPILCHAWFRTVMSRNRFCEIKRYLHVVDNSLASTTTPSDKLWKIRPMIQILQERSQRMYNPHQQVSVDESMIGTKARLSFLQYMPKKPIKWGIKVWVCSDSVTGYIYTFDVYVGADPSIPKYPKGLAHHVVMKLLQPLFGKGYVVYMDNFYSSPALFEDLLAEQITANGTVRSNRKNFPKFCSITPKPPRGTCRFQYCKNMLALCWHDRREILALSTDVGDMKTKVSRRVGTDVIQVDCPVVIDDYNTFMGGVDMADQYMCYYTLGRKTRKWWRHVFWRLFDQAILNALIIYRSNHRNSLQRILSHKDFRLQLAHKLCAGALLTSRVTRRSPSQNLSRLLGKHFLYRTDVKARCVVCGNKRVSSRSNRKRDKKVKTRCKKCDVNLCVGHCFELYHTRVNYLREN